MVALQYTSLDEPSFKHCLCYHIHTIGKHRRLNLTVLQKTFLLLPYLGSPLNQTFNAIQSNECLILQITNIKYQGSVAIQFYRNNAHWKRQQMPVASSAAATWNHGCLQNVGQNIIHMSHPSITYVTTSTRLVNTVDLVLQKTFLLLPFLRFSFSSSFNAIKSNECLVLQITNIKALFQFYSIETMLIENAKKCL
jgi:hypothetical protein